LHVGDSNEFNPPLSPNSRLNFFRTTAGIDAVGSSYHPDLVPSFKRSTSTTSLGTALVKSKPKPNQSFRVPFGLGLSDMRASFRKGMKRVIDNGRKGSDAF